MRAKYLIKHCPQWAYNLYMNNEEPIINLCDFFDLMKQWLRIERVTRQCMISQVVGEYLERHNR